MATELPDVGPASIGGVELPDGRRLYGDQPVGSPAVLWATDEPLDDFPGVWRALRMRAQERGLVAVHLSGLGGDQGDRPWDSREFSPGHPPADAGPAAGQLLAQWWSGDVPDGEEDEDETTALLAPFAAAFPGLAEGEQESLDDANLQVAMRSSLPDGRLGVVAADRPADVVAVLGWHGAVNSGHDPQALSIVLRSWEVRFGATLVGIGFDTIQLLVERPPRSPEAAQRVAAEYFAFCSDSVYQGAGSIRQLADDLQGGPIWSFWWD